MVFELRGPNVILENFAADLLPSRDQHDEERLSNLLLHIDQLEQAIRLLHNLTHLQDIPIEDSKSTE